MQTLTKLSAETILKSLPIECHRHLLNLLFPSTTPNYDLSKFLIMSNDKVVTLNDGWFLVFAGDKYLGLTCHANSFIFYLYISLIDIPNVPCFDVYYIPTRDYNDILELQVNLPQEDQPNHQSHLRLTNYYRSPESPWHPITSIRELRQATAISFMCWQEWHEEPPCFNLRYWFHPS